MTTPTPPTIPEWFLPSEAKEKKGIELVKFINDNGNTGLPCTSPSEFKLVERISYDVAGFDLIKGTYESNQTAWYLGHWNDGVL